MCVRNISITLETARVWYNSGKQSFKELALQAFTEEELKGPYYESIVTYEDVCRVIRTNPDLNRYVEALRKLILIRAALNKGYKPCLVEGDVYIPWIRLVDNYDKAIRVVDSHTEICGKVKINGSIHYLIGGDVFVSKNGACDLTTSMGDIHYGMGLLCCKSAKIARHMAKHFAKEIFNAIYGLFDYEWINE